MRAVRGRAGAVSGLRAAASVYNGAGTRAHGDAEVTEVTCPAARPGPGDRWPAAASGASWGQSPARWRRTPLGPPSLSLGPGAAGREGSSPHPREPHEARSLKTKTKQPAPQNQRRSQKNTFFSFLDPL